MANEKRLIDIDNLIEDLGASDFDLGVKGILESEWRRNRVEAVEVADPELRKAIKLLIEQYEHSKASDYVHNPVAHAFFHTWKKIDESGHGGRKDNG